MRKKIHLTIDKYMLQKIDFISSELYLPKGIIFDALMTYSLRKQLTPSRSDAIREKITTTVNPDTWLNFKEYCDLNHFKYNQLVETALSKDYRNFLSKIKASKSNSENN